MPRALAVLIVLACAPSSARAQAEPAPEDYVPPSKRNAAPQKKSPPEREPAPATGEPAPANEPAAEGGAERAPAESGAERAPESGAERAPAESGSERAPAESGAERAPVESESAEGAPASPPPRRAKPAPEPPPRWNLAVAPRLSILVGGSAAGIPTVGYGAGVRLHFAFLPFGPLRLGAGLQFAYDRFTRDKPGFSYASTTQVLSHAAFSALVLLDGLFGRVRPWIGVGGGFSVADYQDPTVMGTPSPAVAIVSVVPLVTVAFGVGVRVADGFELGLRGDAELTFSSDSTGSPPRTLFSPGVFGLCLDLGFRF